MTRIVRCRPRRIPVRNAGAILAPLVLAGVMQPVPDAQAAVIAGSPTYQSTSSLFIDRGTFRPGGIVRGSSSTGFNGGGATGAATGPLIVPAPENGPNAPGATGSATDTQLRSFSRVAGEMGTADPATPRVEASNRSEVIRYFTFSNPGGSTVALDFLSFFDGTLRAGAFYELLGGASADMVFGLDIIGTQPGTRVKVFETRAGLNLVPSNNTWTFNTSVRGPADPANLAAAFIEGTGASHEAVYDAQFAEVLIEAARVPVGTIIGFNWYLETLARMEGEYVFQSLIAADFGSTAVVDLRISAVDEATASFEEVASVPSVVQVDAPAPAGLMLAGCLLAAFRLRRPGRYVGRR